MFGQSVGSRSIGGGVRSGPAVGSGWLRLRRGVCCCDGSKLITFAESCNNYLQHPAKNYDEHIDNGGENAKRKRGDSGHGRRRCRRQVDSRATKNIVYHWSSANRVGPRFYLRFLELCNKMKVKVDPIKVMNGDKMTNEPTVVLRCFCNKLLIHLADVVCVATGAGSSSAQGRGSDVLAKGGRRDGDAMSQTGSP